MKAQVILLAIGASVCIAAPTITTQYHAQDELGQYVYGYAGGPSAKHEEKSADGVTKGGYSYVDGHGLVQSASYVSDPVNGFRVAATNLPVGPAVPARPAVVATAPAVVAAAPVAVATQQDVVASGLVEAAPVPVSVPAEAAVEVAPVVVEEVIKNENIENPEKPEENYELPEENSELPEISEEKAEEPIVETHTPVVENNEAVQEGTIVNTVGVIASSPAVQSIIQEPVVIKAGVESIQPAQDVITVIPAGPVQSQVAIVPLHIAAQYHAQDELGQYVYGYTGGPSAKHEEKTFDGITKGGYSYVDANGAIQSAAYVSDPLNGFRIAATNLPKPREPEYIPDSPEVAEAKAKLFKAQADHIAKLSS